MTYVKHWRKSQRLIYRGKVKMLDSGFYENQTWGALHRAWKGYVIAKNKDEYDKLLHYANAIQELQYDLGLRVSSFPDIGKPALGFYSARAFKIAQDNKICGETKSVDSHNSQNASSQEEEKDRDDEVDHQYEQEKYTDEWTENYTGDPEFEKERYTDEWTENYAEESA